MDTVYLISLIVGGFFVLLSIFGGGESDSDVDADHDFDFDADHDLDFDADHDFDFDADADHDFDFHSDVGSGPGLVDLFSVRALFLFAAFFGLTGTLLTWLDASEVWTLVASILTGLAIGLGGNWVIKSIGYRTVSSEATAIDIRGATGKVLVPFEGDERGKIALISKGKRLQLLARSFDDENQISFEPGEEVVVVRMEGSVAHVVKPN
jgi:hypothetical protein